MTDPFRGPLALGFAALAVLLLALGGWSAFARLSGAVIAPALVEVERNRQIVQHPDGGVVAQVLVTEGARVAAGDVLIRLDGAALLSDLSIVEAQLDEITARRARLEAERDDAAAPAFPADLLARAAQRPDVADQVNGQSRLFTARAYSLAQETAQLGRRIDQVRAQIAGVDAQALALDRQLALIRQELAGQQGLLDKGLAQAGTVLALQREEARLSGQMGELAAARAQAEGRITETEIQIARLTADRREQAAAELREIGPPALELAERRRALAGRIARLDIRAPVAGVVLGLAVTTPRAVVTAAQPLLYLVPQDRPLLIAARVAPTDIDQVHPGQPVDLMFPAFSGRSMPPLAGRVTVVSADAFTDPSGGAAFYRVEVALDPGQLDGPDAPALLPGMPAEAYLATGARAPIAWLMQPFTDYFTRALRES